jgi:hypothetical protein
MARWLALQGVTDVAMEATGMHTTPVYHALAEPGCFEQALVQRRASQERARPPTDAAGAFWLAELLECGLLQGSLIPEEKIKAVRGVVRYRLLMSPAVQANRTPCRRRIVRRGRRLRSGMRAQPPVRRGCRTGSEARPARTRPERR